MALFEAHYDKTGTPTKVTTSTFTGSCFMFGITWGPLLVFALLGHLLQGTELGQIVAPYALWLTGAAVFWLLGGWQIAFGIYLMKKSS